MTRTLITTMLLAAALTAGCGGEPAGTGVASIATGSAQPTAGATPTGTTDPQEQGRRWAKCMREHGVPVEDPDPNGGGGLNALVQQADKGKVQDAVKACRELAPFKDRGELKPEDIEQLRQFAKCMRENGVNMPDPNPDGTFGGDGAAGGIKRDSPKFQKAFEVCRDKFPKMGAAK
ncbi:hypothetical protein ACBJ59_38755 [Nonomuraea sp. MTCD27]|uniref:hypothetical protein n=1 Tax=Nonomuraea sp. MTCD27 TaxID=1676747 RepID=UPI0035C1F347